MRARAESFGAWVRLDEPRALVAVDRARARRLGVEGGALWEGDPESEAPTAPLEVHLAVTSRCSVGCAGCYLDATPEGTAPPFEALEARLSQLAQAGVFTVAFGGGEPLGRRDLGALAERASGLGLVPVMTTSGVGLTAARARELRAFAQVNVSHDGVEGGYEAVRGRGGAQAAERAIELLAQAGVRVGVNMVLTRQNFVHVEATAAKVAALGAREVQLLRYKPAGRGADLTYLARRLDRAQVASVPSLLDALVRRAGLSVRVDCAMVPWLSMSSLDPGAAERLGVLGCEGARRLAASTVDGRVAPCSFAPATPLAAEALGEGWASEPQLEAFRAHADRAPEPCASCPWRRVCRGGCRVVAAFLGDPGGPDPECPRVLAHRQAHAAGASQEAP